MKHAHNFVDLTGKKFGRLTVQSSKGRNHFGKLVWECRCACGKTTEVIGANLKSGATTSCGCFHVQEARARFTTHGQRQTPLYRVWLQMKNRCSNPKDNSFKYYGALGVKVCKRWRDSFAAFLKDMGPRPRGRSIDRYPDNAGDYKPGNCRWATRSQQQKNKRIK